jgi:tetratricopeptide (TPR) repeat protein
MRSLNRIRSGELYSAEPRGRSLYSSYYFHFFHALYYRHMVDWAKNSFHTWKNVELFESNPWFLKENMSHYVSALANLSLAQLELMQFDESEATLKRLFAIDAKEAALRLKIESIYFPRMAAIYMLSGNFERISHVVDQMETLVRTERGKFGEWRISAFYYNTALCYFGMGKYREALHWLNRLLNDRKLEQSRPDLYSSSRLFNLIVHLELENDELLEHLLRSTHRDLSRKGKLFDLEALVLKFISRMIADQGKRKATLTEFRQEVGSLVTTDPDSEVPAYFDYLSWVESKLTSKPFAALVKEAADSLRKKMPAVNQKEMR